VFVAPPELEILENLDATHFSFRNGLLQEPFDLLERFRAWRDVMRHEIGLLDPLFNRLHPVSRQRQRVKIGNERHEISLGLNTVLPLDRQKVLTLVAALLDVDVVLNSKLIL
jgi:hypothetical protein